MGRSRLVHNTQVWGHFINLHKFKSNNFHHSSSRTLKSNCCTSTISNNIKNTNCPSKKVWIRPSHFLKLTYTLERSFNAEHHDAFLFENSGVFMKIWWDEVWCLKMFPLISCCVVQINKNRVWIVVVCCLMITMIYAILIFGKNWEIMILEHKP